MRVNGYTPTQAKILALLSDGLPHSRKEIHGCLPDELSNITTIQAHISYMRKSLRPKGEDILCEIYNRTVHYRHVRLIGSSDG